MSATRRSPLPTATLVASTTRRKESRNTRQSRGRYSIRLPALYVSSEREPIGICAKARQDRLFLLRKSHIIRLRHRCPWSKDKGKSGGDANLRGYSAQSKCARGRPEERGHSGRLSKPSGSLPSVKHFK